MGAVFFPGDSYVTPQGKSRFWQSLFSYPWLFWYANKIVRENGMRAMRGGYTGEDWSRGSLDALEALESLGIRLHVDGMNVMDKVPGACIFAANHMSTMETVVLPAFIQPRKNVTFVVKESLMRYKWFKWILKSRDPIVLTRESPRKDFEIMMREGMDRLAKGLSVIVFPQGTRQQGFDTEKFNSIGVKLAKRAGVPVIPLALRTDALKTGMLIKDFGGIDASLPVHFSFGEPVYVLDATGKEAHAQVCAFIADRLRSWGVPVAADMPEQENRQENPPVC